MDQQKTKPDDNTMLEKDSSFDTFDNANDADDCDGFDEYDDSDEMESYEDIEKKCEEIRCANGEFLELFKKDLAGLSAQTVRRHLSNANFYINNYLLYEEPLSMQEGVDQADDFFGYFFIRKCMWSTPATIKSTATSIKKFYKSMMDHGKISKDDYMRFCDAVKTGMDDWQDDCEQYNDPDAPNPFFMF